MEASKWDLLVVTDGKWEKVGDETETVVPASDRLMGDGNRELRARLPLHDNHISPKII
jgi:hypothetical protein